MALALLAGGATGPSDVPHGPTGSWDGGRRSPPRVTRRAVGRRRRHGRLVRAAIRWLAG